MLYFEILWPRVIGIGVSVKSSRPAKMTVSCLKNRGLLAIAFCGANVNFSESRAN